MRGRWKVRESSFLVYEGEVGRDSNSKAFYLLNTIPEIQTVYDPRCVPVRRPVRSRSKDFPLGTMHDCPSYTYYNYIEHATA